MGDAAFGMTGLDFETAVRAGIPILTVVLNNSGMAIEIPHLVVSHDKYGTRDIGGRYADLALAMGGWAERVERPEEIARGLRAGAEGHGERPGGAARVHHQSGDGVLEPRRAPIGAARTGRREQGTGRHARVWRFDVMTP